jgi:hypothetical protein
MEPSTFRCGRIFHWSARLSNMTFFPVPGPLRWPDGAALLLPMTEAAAVACI